MGGGGGSSELLRTTLRQTSGVRAALFSGETLLVSECTFENCTAREPLGETILHVYSNTGAPHGLDVVGSQFVDNDGQGRPIVGWAATLGLSVRIEDCAFVGNDGTAAGFAPLGVVRSAGDDADSPAVTFLGNTIARSIGYSLGHPDDSYRLPVGATVSRNAITGGAVGLYEPPGGLAVVTSNLVWANGVNWSEVDRTGLDGNLSEPPKYCGAASRNFLVASNSPLLPGNNGSGVQIGAFGQGCGPLSVDPVPWGRIKALYRSE